MSRGELSPYEGTLLDVRQGIPEVNNAVISAAKRSGVEVHSNGRYMLLGFTPDELSGRAARAVPETTSRSLAKAIPNNEQTEAEETLF